MQHFLSDDQIAANAAANGDASAQAMFERLAADVNTGARSLGQLLRSFILLTDDGGVAGVLSLLNSRDLTASDLLASVSISGVSITATSLEVATAIASQFLNLTLDPVTFTTTLDGIEPGVGGTITPDDGGPVIDPDGGTDELPPIDPVDPVDVQTMTLEEQVTVLMPWLPSVLVDAYVQGWVDGDGDANLALAAMRAAPEYEDFFAGNRRDDGTVRLSESDWIAQMEGYSLEMLGFGLNPEVFINQGLFAEAIVNGLSVAEFGARLTLTFDQILGNNLDEVKAFYSQAYGIEMTDEAIFASVLDPSVADAIIQGQVAVAQIGAAGLTAGFGFEETLPEAERLAAIGLGQGQALQLFGSAAGRVPVLTSLARRFFDADPTFDLDEFISGQAFGDAFQRRREARLLARDQAQFTGTGSLARGQSGELAGLVSQS